MRPEEIAYNRGYTVDKKGTVFNKVGEKVILSKNDQGYLIFGTGSRIKEDNPFYNISVHRLQAFIKFKKELYKNQCVRHIDGDKQNNSFNNIILGSYIDNYHDIPKSRRKKILLKMAKTKRSLSKETIELIHQLRSEGKYYYEIANLVGVSKGWVWAIVNKKTSYHKI